MNRARLFSASLAVLAALVFSGCHRHGDGDPNGDHDHDHDHAPAGEDHHADETSGAQFDDALGIRLGDEAAGQIGIETQPAATRPLAVEFHANARVYETAHAHSPKDGERTHHDSHAAAMLSAHLAGYLAPGQSVEIRNPDRAAVTGRLRRLEAATERAIGQVEAIIDVPDPEHRLDFGAFIDVRFQGGEREALAVPRTALLEAATGTFVYVQLENHFRRTPVQAGAGNAAWIEITSGLSEGDVVVARGAVDLWLIELRFTKGGGHAH
jgi:hypothetical protein